MKQQLKNELKRAFFNPVFYGVILLEIVFVIAFFIKEVYPVWTETVPFYKSNMETGKVNFIPGAYYTWIGFRYSPFRSILFAILPILAALPYGASLYGDEKSRYTVHLFTRGEKRDYYVAKLFVMFLSGGVASVFPFAASLFMNMLVLPLETVLSSTSYFMNGTVFLSDLFYQAPFVYILCYMFIVFAGFGLINGICYAASCFLESRVVVSLAPFAVYFTTFVIAGFDSRIVVPWEYLRINDMKSDDVPAVFIQLLGMILILAVCVLYKSRRKADAL